MIHPQHTRAVGAVLVGLLVVMALPVGSGVARAQSSDDSVLGRILDVEVSGFGDTVDGFLGLASGGFDRARAFLSGPDRSVEDCRDDLMDELNRHSNSYLRELNAKTTPSTSRDVLRVHCVEDPRRPWKGTSVATFYVVANVSNGTYESSTAVETTDRAVDETVVLRRVAREELADDLAAYRETYIEGNKTVGTGYQQRVTAKYGGSVYGTISALPSIPEEYQDLEDTTGGDGS